MNSCEKKYVAAYCRVSTDRGEQASSFESQMRFFREYIEKNPKWILYDIYADEGITGTNVKKREGFKRMMRDAKNGKFELILTKEISRFARNLLDSVSYTRALKRMGVGVYFMNDGIDTRDADAELRLAILSSIAQEESRRTSERVKWGQKRRMEAGVVFGHSLLGYDVKNGSITINEAGARVVRRIFYLFCEEEMGVSSIARRLSEEGFLPQNGNAWSPSVIYRMLKNEKYCGDLTQKKTITPDYLSHEKKYNHGEEDLIIIQNHHEPIISRERFEKAQLLLHERKERKTREKYSARYAFSGKIRCGLCGKTMRARVQKRKNGVYHHWRCEASHASIPNDVILSLLKTSIERYSKEITEAKRLMMQGLSAFLTDEKYDGAHQKLLELYLLGEISREEYALEKARFAQREERLAEMEKILENAHIDEWFLREVVSHILMYPDHAEVYFYGLQTRISVDILKIGRKYHFELNDIQAEKGNDSLLFVGEN